MSTGQAQNLADGSVEAVHALVRSIAGVPLDRGTEASSDVMRKLTEKLGELVGEDAAKSFAKNYNEWGEMLNEEGLPIIDITEPITGGSKVPSPAVLVTEVDLVPLDKLTLKERERQRRERDRILDLLEAEEILEQERIESAESDIRQNKGEKRGANTNDLRQLKAAKDLQKKMGKSLLKSIELNGPKGALASVASSHAEAFSEPLSSKKVTFADFPDTPDDVHGGHPGSVSLARLQNLERPNLMTKFTHLPMKMEVVEHHSGDRRSLPQDNVEEKDSDDESVVSHASTTTSSDNQPMDDSVTFSDTADDGAPVLEDEEFDINSVRHYREIALEYYRKRSTVGAATHHAIFNHDISGLENEHNIGAEVPFHDNSARPPLSQFKAAQIASKFSTASSRSLDNVLPASSVKTVQNAIRMGKLDDNNQLVGGGTVESDEEDDGALTGVLELIKTGHITNVGPAKSSHLSEPTATNLSGVSGAFPSITGYNPSSLSNDILPTRTPTTAALSSKVMGVQFQESHANINQLQASTRSERTQSPLVSSNPLIVNSPSFPPPSSRPERPPVVMSSTVLENANKQGSQGQNSALNPAKKMSRFMRERAG